MEINVEEVMKEIRQKIEKKGYSLERTTFKEANCAGRRKGEFLIDAVKDSVNSLEASSNVQWKQEITVINIKTMTKKIVQKMVGFNISTYCARQNMYNEQLATSFSQLIELIDHQEKKLNEYENRLTEIQKKIEEMENR